jgi:hypothetical protein
MNCISENRPPISEIRALWEKIWFHATHSLSRAPLVLDEQERAVIPSQYDPDRGKSWAELQPPFDDELVNATKTVLTGFLHDQKRPDETETWSSASDLVPKEVSEQRGTLIDLDWPVAWFTWRLLEDAMLRDAYLGVKNKCKDHYSDAERVDFLRCLACLVAYSLKAITEASPEPVTPPAPISELEFGNALLYMVAEYAHVVLELPRRLAIEKHLQALLGAETGLYLTQDFYRDHTFHMVYVCLLGDFLLQCETKGEPLAVYLNRWCRPGDANDDVAKVVWTMRRNWYLTALFHDLGYPLSLLRSMDRLTDFLDCEDIQRLRSSIKVARTTAIAEFVEKADAALGLGCKLARDQLDHGVVSALFLRRLLDDVEQDDGGTEQFLPAVLAIARHSVADAKFSVELPKPVPTTQDSNTMPTSQDNNALSLLLLLCDEAQEWGRVRVDPKRYRQEVAAKMQFGGENPLESQRILHFLALNVRWREGRFQFLNDEIVFDLIYRPLQRSEETYLAIWLNRTRNFQRVSLPNASDGSRFLQIRVNSFWKHQARNDQELDDLEILANYVRNYDRWELDGWLEEACGRKKRIAYKPPEKSGFGEFRIDLNELAGTNLLHEAPDIGELFRWLRTYPARLSARMGK